MYLYLPHSVVFLTWKQTTMGELKCVQMFHISIYSDFKLVSILILS